MEGGALGWAGPRAPMKTLGSAINLEKQQKGQGGGPEHVTAPRLMVGRTAAARPAKQRPAAWRFVVSICLSEVFHVIF